MESKSRSPQRSARKGVRCIGVVSGSAPNEWAMEIISGAEDELVSRRLSLVVASSTFRSSDGTSGVEALLRRVDGLVFIAPRSAEREFVECARRDGIPVAVIAPSLPCPGAVVVRSDNVHGASEVARHLCELSHRRIAFVSGPRDCADSRDRAAGLERGLAERGLAIAPGHKLFRERYHPDEGTLYADLWLGTKRSQAPSAVVFGNDCMALAFMRRVQGRGRRIPDDVSVVGFDDAPSAQLAFPGLTTSRQETRHMGALACRKLLSPDRVEREPAVAFPMRLVVRQSTGVARN